MTKDTNPKNRPEEQAEDLNTFSFKQSQPSAKVDSQKNSLFLHHKYFLLMFIIIIGIGIFTSKYYQVFKKESIDLANPTGMQPTPTLHIEPSVIYNPPLELSLAHNEFGFDIFHKLINTKDDTQNIFISPSSIALALSMVYNGADNKTKDAMTQTLHFSKMDLEKINTSGSELIKHLTSLNPDIEVSIANSIWMREEITFNPQFLETNKKYYEAQVQAIDFSSPNAANIINSWVSTNTRSKIPSIVSSPIDKDVVMYLINAIYFKGIWTYEFDTKLTKEKSFTLPDLTKINHPSMTQERKDYFYLENDDFQGIYLPYGKEKNIGMYVLLPKDNISQLENKLSLDNWNNWVNNFKEKEGTLILPKFKIEYDKELKDTLSSLGMGVAFSDNADFSKMRSENDIKISKVKHKTYINLDEKGTEATAVTSVEMVFTTSLPNEKDTFYMEVNKPFFFAITDRESKEILFMGVVNNPQE